MVLSSPSGKPVFPCMDDPLRAFFALTSIAHGARVVQQSTNICNKPLVLEPYAGSKSEVRERHSGCRDPALKPVEMGARMRLRIGFTLATVFLALFTAALWKERSRKEGRR